MSIEVPDNNEEQIKSVEEEKNVIEMSPEDFAEMIDQLPPLREMLKKWEAKLADLEKDPNVNAEEIETLKNEMEGLCYQISEREELLEK